MTAVNFFEANGSAQEKYVNKGMTKKKIHQISVRTMLLLTGTKRDIILAHGVTQARTVCRLCCYSCGLLVS